MAKQVAALPGAVEGCTLSDRSFSLRPEAWPRSGPVRRLYLKYAGGQFASVYVEQSAWPRQRTNPRWRIAVERIDWRYDEETRSRIKASSYDDALAGLSLWLAEQAPAVSLETASWQELVRFATASARRSSSDVKRRSKRPPQPYRSYSKARAQYPVDAILSQ